MACSHGGVYSVDPKMVRLDCSSSVNPLGAPGKAVRAIERSAGELAPMYPDPECRDLKKGLARYLGVNTDQIAVGNGAAEIIYWFARLFAKRRVVIPAPTFCEYELASQKAGAVVTFVPLAVDFALDADAVIASAKGVDALFLCNPNNPTGMLATRAIKKVIEDVDNTTKIMLDECFIELADRQETLLKLVDRHDNLVVLRSLTKSFGMAGLRAGYSVSSPALAGQLSSLKVPWNVNGLAQAAGVAALADRRHVAKARALVKKERAFLYERLNRLESLVPVRSDANYLLLRLKSGDSTHFRDRLMKKTGVLVRDCSTFTGMGSQHVRIAVKTHKENMMLVKALEEMDNGKAR
ncbi:MAG: pyridoxal phosphate-dependent aminotransferase [Nitrososphaera sp.]|uniref:pyridoxal phosphate-dependent aminotransferase n=1 Tax=Nitrososphaera sp. TaxID=1971748 RepID=UPI003D6F36B8